MAEDNRKDLDLSSATILVSVGNDEPEDLHIHANLLRSHSTFFRAALSQTWKEGNEGRIELPEDSPFVVNRYFKWLYQGELFFKYTTSGVSVECLDNLPANLMRANLYIFGERIGDIRFKNAVMDKWVARMNTRTERRDLHYCPSPTIIDIIYGGTIAGSPARKLLVDCYQWSAEPEWMQRSPPQDYNMEFMVDLTRALLDSVAGVDISCITTVRQRVLYQEEEDGTSERV